MVFIPDPQKKEERKEFISVLIAGKSGAGKTRMSTTAHYNANEVLTFSADGNTQDIVGGIINLVQPQEVEITDEKGKVIGKKILSKAELFSHYLNLLLDDNKAFTKELQKQGYKTIVIDTMDHIAEWEEYRIVKSLGLEDKSEDIALEHAKGAYTKVAQGLKTLFIAMIEAIKYDFNLILISFEDREESMIPGTLTKEVKYFSSIKSKVSNSLGIDRHGIFDAIQSRIGIVGRIYSIDIKDEDGLVTDTQRVFNCLTTSTNEGFNRYGIENLIIPDWKVIEQKVLEYRKGK